ncbi:hypothetical protein [Nostoc sp.]|uniref:hypothetical protein n=1 Tax=Nostoc sp. TaxID=1180 RepID=UPI002FF9B026
MVQSLVISHWSLVSQCLGRVPQLVLFPHGTRCFANEKVTGVSDVCAPTEKQATRSRCTRRSVTWRVISQSVENKQMTTDKR